MHRPVYGWIFVVFVTAALVLSHRLSTYFGRPERFIIRTRYIEGLPTHWIDPRVKPDPDEAQIYHSILDRIRENVCVDDEEVEVLRRHRNNALTDLHAALLRYDSDNTAALNAALYLDKLDFPLGREFIFGVLIHPKIPTGLKRNALIFVKKLNSQGRSLSQDETNLCKRFLDDPDPEMRHDVAEVLLDTPGINPSIAKILRDPKVYSRGWLTCEFLKKTRSAETIRTLVPLIYENLSATDDADAKEHWINALVICSKHPDKPTAQIARDAFNEEYQKLPQSLRYSHVLIYQSRDLFQESSLPALNDALKNAPYIYSRWYALEAIAQIRGNDALPLISGWLIQPEMREGCIAALSRVINDKNRQAILEQLATNYGKTPPAEPELNFLLEHGGDRGKNLAIGQLSHIAPEDRMVLAWHLNNWKLEDFAAGLASAGLIAQIPSTGEMEKFREEWCTYNRADRMDKNEPEMVPKFLTYLGLLYAPLENPERKPGYDHLIPKLMEQSKGMLFVQSIKQNPVQKNDGDDRGPYFVEFVYNQKPYQFKAPNLKDAYDYDLVRDVLNTVLEEKKVPERYLMMNFESDYPYFVFGKPSVWESVSDRFFIRLRTKEGWDTKNGRIFEKRVKDSMPGSTLTSN